MEIAEEIIVLDGYTLSYRVVADDRRIQFNHKKDGPLNAALNFISGLAGKDKSELHISNLTSGTPFTDGSFYYALKPPDSRDLSGETFSALNISWVTARMHILNEPVWVMTTGWDDFSSFIPYSSILKIAILELEIASRNTSTIKKLIQAQAGIPIEELLKSPNVKTGTWLDDEFPCCPEENPDVKEPYPYRNPPQPKGRDALELVEEVVDQTGRYVYSHNKIDQSIADGNRDFAIRVLKNNGLYPKPTDEQGLEKVARLKLKDVPKLLEAMGRLNLYAASEERRRWNPEALATDSLAETLVSYDWFLYQRLPSEWDEFDALARLERIFKDEKPTSPGFIYTKLFGLRLRMIVRMELNERLVLAAAEEMEL